MFSGIRIIYRKELIDTLRDRKTLLFMLLIPTVAIPLLMIGITRLAERMQKKTAVEVIRVAADAESHAAYRRLIHEWFVDTQLATGKRLKSSAIFESLFSDGGLAGLSEIPPDILTDAEAFERWTHELAGKAREDLDASSDVPSQELGDVPDALIDSAMDFYRVALKGLGQIEFVDPSTLPLPTEEAEHELPETFRDVPFARRAAAAIREKTIHAQLVVRSASSSSADAPTTEILLLHDSTIHLSDEALARVKYVGDKIFERLLITRIRDRGISPEFLTPLKLLEGTDLASKSQIVLSAIGGLLPYFVIAFAFLGGMYPAIDLGAGEKERNTLETLILSPCSRTEIAIGKFLVILTTSLTAALLGLISIAVSIRYVLPAAIVENMNLTLSPMAILGVALLAIPPAAAFAGLFLAISIYARSFKEAQNYITPLQFVLILPALAPMLPGIEMSWTIAAIPLVNVSMLSKEFLRGQIEWGYYAVTLGSCLLAAAGCLAYAVAQFQREEVLFRS